MAGGRGLTHCAYGGQAVYIATRYWQKSTADDQRITIEPDLAIPFSSSDYLAGRDPVLDEVIREPVAGG